MTPFPIRNLLICRLLTSFQRGHWWIPEGPTAMAHQLLEHGGVLTAKDQTILGVCFALYNGTGDTTVASVMLECTEYEVSVVTGAMIAVLHGNAAWWPSSTPVQRRGLRIRALKIADPKAWKAEVQAAGSDEKVAAKTLGVSVKLLREWMKELGT